MARRRLDAELVRRGLARSREEASALVNAGSVLVDGATATKVATQVEASAALLVRRRDDDPGYVSRGAFKLAGALDAFPDLKIAGRRAMDAGASTGGFTDVLIRRDAKEVLAVDVGYGQLAWSLQTHDRVIVKDRTNVRELTPEEIGGGVELIVADLSFISLLKVLPALLACALPEADLVLMVKPQFEVGKARLGAGGVVRDPALRAEAVTTIATHAYELGLGVRGVVASPLPGPAGNVEYFLWLSRGAEPLDPADLQRAIEEGPS